MKKKCKSAEKKTCFGKKDTCPDQDGRREKIGHRNSCSVKIKSVKVQKENMFWEKGRTYPDQDGLTDGRKEKLVHIKKKCKNAEKKTCFGKKDTCPDQDGLKNV